MNYLANEGAMPSVALAIIVDDELAWSGAYGESGTIDARYNAGSIAKPLTATAVLQLSERGQLDSGPAASPEPATNIPQPAMTCSAISWK